MKYPPSASNDADGVDKLCKEEHAQLTVTPMLAGKHNKNQLVKSDCPYGRTPDLSPFLFLQYSIDCITFLSVSLNSLIA